MIVKVLTEFVGTLAFTFFGSLSTGPVWAVALGNGMALMLAVALTTKISGGHINPAVSLASAIGANHHETAAWAQSLAYIGAQFLGAIVGFAMTIPLSSGGDELSLSPCPMPQDPRTLLVVFYETLCTVFLLVAVFAPLPHRGLFRPSIIGGTAAIAIMSLNEISGVVMNPARLLAPTVEFPCKWRFVFPFLFGEVIAVLLVGVFLFVANQTTLSSNDPEREGLELG